MDELRNFFSENREAFDTELPAEGHKYRFEERLRLSIRKKRLHHNRRITVYYLTAAILLIVAIPLSKLFLASKTNGNYSSFLYYEKLMDEKCKLLYDRTELIKSDEKDIALNTIDQLRYESIPFSEQIWVGLTTEEENRILKEYYTAKFDGLDRVAAYIDKLLKI